MRLAVHCAHDELVPIGDLRSNPNNPNKHPTEQIRLLAKIIEATGWRAPITVSTRSGLITRGHCRMMAAQKLGAESVPVDYQDYDSEAEELADVLADNKIAELASLDLKMTTEILLDFDANNFDIELAGFVQDELEKLATWAPDDTDTKSDGASTRPEVFDLVVHCDNKQEQSDAMSAIINLGYRVDIK